MLCTHGEGAVVRNPVIALCSFERRWGHGRAIIQSLRQSRDSRRTDTHQHDAALTQRPF